MKVPFLDLTSQYEALQEEIAEALEAVLKSQRFINGPEVHLLEERVSALSNCVVGVGVSSGTDALLCGLMALGVGSGDEVITSPYSFFATAGAIARVGAKPVYVDIRAETFNIDPTKVEDAVTPRTRAIIPVHLFGQVADMDPILKVAEAYDLAVIEDAAQAIGASYCGRQAGSMGTLGCLSFFPSKNLGGAGDGGMIVTTDPNLGDRLAILRNHGAQPKYFHQWIGGNFRLDTLQAAYLLVKLNYLETWSEKRRANAAIYDRLLASVSEVVTPWVGPHNVSIYNQYVIRAQRRDQLREYLVSAGVSTEIYYPRSLHQQECFAYLGYKDGDFPESEKASKESLALPIYPELRDDQIYYVVSQIKSFYAC